MIVEKIVFNVLAVALFILIFAKLIRKNDTTYINVLIAQFVGIAINFIELLFSFKLNIIIRCCIYLLSIVLPIMIFIIEKNGISITESISIISAKIKIALNKNEEARKVLLKLIDKYPNSYYAHKMLAEVYEKENKISTAIEEYVRTVEINLKDYNSYFKIAVLLQKIEKTDEAISMLNDLLKKKPDFYEASDLLGDIYYNENRFKEALSVYLDALQYNSTKYEINYNIGMVYTRLNDFQKAKEYYERAAKINSMLYNGKYNIGQIALILGDIEEAEKYFMECLNGEDVEAGSYYYLAQISLLKGNNDKALNYINIAIELEPEIYKEVEEQLIFQPIKDQIRKSNEKNTRVSTLTKKEKLTQKHLDDTYNLVENLNNVESNVEEKIEDKQIEEEKDERTLE